MPGQIGRLQGDVSDMLFDRSGNLWIGTAGGLDRLDRELGQFRHYPFDYQDPEGLVWLSDGHENSSQNVSQRDLVERMQALEATDQWTFTFMCANVDITNLTRNLGVEPRNVDAWQATHHGVAVMKEKVAYSVREYMEDRRKGMRSKKDFYKKFSS